MLIYLFLRERERASEGQREKERGLSRLPLVSAGPDKGLDLTTMHCDLSQNQE